MDKTPVNPFNSSPNLKPDFFLTFHNFFQLCSQAFSGVFFPLPWVAFAFVLYEIYEALTCRILIFGVLYFYILRNWQCTRRLEDFTVKSLAFFVLVMVCLYFVPQFSVMAPTLLLVIPSITFYLSHDIVTTFLTFSFQLLVNKFFLEPKCVDALLLLQSADNTTFNFFFSSFNFFSFLALCFQFSLLSEGDTDSLNKTLESKLLESQAQIARLEQNLRQSESIIRTHQDTLLTIAHECKNPLNGVQSNLELAEAMLSDHTARQSLDLDKIEAFVHNSRICGEFLLQNLNDILDAGKIESSNLEINPAPTDIKSLLEKAWAICRESIKRKNLMGNLKMKIDVPPFLIVDGHRIIQVLINLINNSIKFTTKGTIFVSVDWKGIEETSSYSNFSRMRSQQFDVGCSIDLDELASTTIDNQTEASKPSQNNKILYRSSSKKGFLREAHTLDLNQTRFEKGHPLLMRHSNKRKGFLIIEVADTGCGIAKEDLPKLFMKFSQVNSDPTQRKIGTGLGLWLCQKICQKMNGSIEVESKLGVGSVFRMKIPAEICENPLKASMKKIPHVSSTNSERLGETFSQKKIKAIVIDDLAYNREVHKLLLKKCNCEVLGEASTGKEAIEQFKSYNGKVDLVVIDLEMPELGGLEACRLIRLYERAQNLKASYIAVISSSTNYTVGKQMGDEKTPLFDHYATKPCPLTEFQKIVEEALMKSMANLPSSFSPKQIISKYKKKVLVVDDDGFCLEVAKNFFESAQIGCVAAINGNEALHLMKARLNEIGCVVMDFEMPGMDGRETLLKMKAFLEPLGKGDIPIYCVSGNNGTSFVNEMTMIGFKEVYVKPLNWKRLISNVERAVDHV